MEITLVLAIAFILGALVQRLGQSAIIGYLLAGTIVGPLMFNRDAVSSVAELGVALLLFSIGLEFSFQRLRRLGYKVLLLGGVQIGLTFAVFALVFSGDGSWQQAVTMGALIAFSSTAIVLRILVDRAQIDSVHGRYALGVLLLQDIAVVPAILLVTIIGSGGGWQQAMLQLVKTIMAAGALLLLYYLIFYYLIPRVLMTAGLFANRELVVLLTIVIALGTTWSAHAIGLSPALGTFLAGMLLAESPFATQIRSDIGSLRTLFVTLFFTSIGMLADPVWLLAHWYQVLGWLLIIVLGKVIIVYLIGLILKLGHFTSLATGLTLGQIGEFSFVVATVARAGGLINQEAFALVISVTILSMFVAPYLVTYATLFTSRLLRWLLPRKLVNEILTKTESETAAADIYVVGFGPAGQRVAEAMLNRTCNLQIIELNPASAHKAGAKGLDVHIGDASQIETLSEIGLKKACLVIVTVPDPGAARTIVKNVKVLSPQSTVIVRSRYHRSLDDLKAAGATLVVDEEMMVGKQLAEQIETIFLDSEREALACALAGRRAETANGR